MSGRKNAPASRATLSQVGRFNFDLASALGQQLKAFFDNGLSPQAMTRQRIDELDRTQGVYTLYHTDSLVYVGQAADLRKRLGEHMKKISGRQYIKVSEVTFACAYIDKAWVPLTHEKALFAIFKSKREPFGWNGSGFGPHDPGRNRETTNKPPLGFDSKFPIKCDLSCDWIKAGHVNANELLKSIKGGLPFLFRYQVDNPKNWQEGSGLYNDLSLEVPQDAMPFKELLVSIREQFPAGWQATIFPSHAILYKEDQKYDHGEIV